MSRTEEVLKHGSFGRLLLNLSLPSVLIIIIMLIYNIAATSTLSVRPEIQR